MTIANRLIALSTGGASTTYGYDAFGTRVFQIIPTTSTTTYPFKFLTVASTTKSSTNFSTSTEFIFGGDTLLSTIDQSFKNGSATGTVAVRYVSPRSPRINGRCDRCQPEFSTDIGLLPIWSDENIKLERAVAASRRDIDDRFHERVIFKSQKGCKKEPLVALLAKTDCLPNGGLCGGTG